MYVSVKFVQLKISPWLLKVWRKSGICQLVDVLNIWYCLTAHCGEVCMWTYISFPIKSNSLNWKLRDWYWSLFYWKRSIEDHNLKYMWFQQVGANDTAIANLQQEKFPGLVISRLSDVSWSSIFCDLTSLYLFLYSVLKYSVYANNPQ